MARALDLARLRARDAPHRFDPMLVERAQKAGARMMERTEAVEPIFGDGWVARGEGPSRRRQGRRAHADPCAVRDRRRRRREPVRQARRDPARRLPPAGDRGPPLLPHRLPPRALVRVVARPVGGRPAAARLRLAVPRGGRPDQPGRGPAQHLQGLQADLGAAAVQRVRDDAARRVGDRRGARRRPGAVRPAADEHEPHAPGRAGHAPDRRRRRRREPVQRRRHRLRDGDRRDRRRADPRGAREGPARASR